MRGQSTPVTSPEPAPAPAPPPEPALDTIDLSTLRRNYDRDRLDEATVAATWFEQFRAWFAAAQADDAIVEPNAVQLATADASARSSVRTVLAKEISPDGLVFYTGYDSAKGRDLAQVPWSAAVFAWLPQQRQVRFTGPTHPVGRAETDRYFAGRPRGSQIGAWASPQSQVVPDRATLERAEAEIEARFAGADVLAAPPRWGGYRLVPVEVEFWQGRQNRLHDRIRFSRADGDGAAGSQWRRERLAP